MFNLQNINYMINNKIIELINIYIHLEICSIIKNSLFILSQDRCLIKMRSHRLVNKFLSGITGCII